MESIVLEIDSYTGESQNFCHRIHTTKYKFVLLKKHSKK